MYSKLPIIHSYQIGPKNIKYKKIKAHKRLKTIGAYLVKPMYVLENALLRLSNYPKFLITTLDARVSPPIGTRYSYFWRDSLSIKIQYLGQQHCCFVSAHSTPTSMVDSYRYLVNQFK